MIWCFTQRRNGAITLPPTPIVIRSLFSVSGLHLASYRSRSILYISEKKNKGTGEAIDWPVDEGKCGHIFPSVLVTLLSGFLSPSQVAWGNWVRLEAVFWVPHLHFGWSYLRVLLPYPGSVGMPFYPVLLPLPIYSCLFVFLTLTSLLWIFRFAALCSLFSFI